jgi:hypothetical protein
VAAIYYGYSYQRLCSTCGIEYETLTLAGKSGVTLCGRGATNGLEKCGWLPYVYSSSEKLKFGGSGGMGGGGGLDRDDPALSIGRGGTGGREYEAMVVVED